MTASAEIDTTMVRQEGGRESEPAVQASPPWRSLLHHYAQSSTLHGIRYVVSTSQYLSRRLIWTTCVCGAFLAFLYLTVTRLQHYFQFTKTVNVDVTYKEDLPFPAVTVCNQNIFRLSAIQRAGLYDLFKEKFTPDAKAETVDLGSSRCEDSFQLAGQGCLDTDAAGLPPHSRVYVEVTLAGCRHLCQTVDDLLCSVVMHVQTQRTCIITQWGALHALLAQGADLDTCTKVHVYRRTRYTDDHPVICDFEDEMESRLGMTGHDRCPYDAEVDGHVAEKYLCSLVEEKADDEDWARVPAKGRIPGKDRTTETDRGYFLQMLDTNSRPGYKAQLSTPYRRTDGFCLQLAFYVKHKEAGLLSIYVVTEDQKKIPLVDSDGQYLFEGDERTVIPISEGEGEWTIVHRALPPGINRVFIEGQRTDKETASGFALDDIFIVNCSHLVQDCKRSSSGQEYLGPHSLDCMPWREVFTSASDPVHFIDGSIAQETSHNSCRYVSAQWGKVPACMPVTTLHLYQLRKECPLIKYCRCRDHQFPCHSGRCLPLHMLCNGRDDCSMGEDEAGLCHFKQNMTCRFEDDYVCGYTRQTTAPVEWQRKLGHTDHPFPHLKSIPGYMQVAYNSANRGDRVALTSPSLTLTRNSCLTFHYHLEVMDPSQSPVTLRLYRTSHGTPAGYRIWTSQAEKSNKSDGFVRVDLAAGANVSVSFEASVSGVPTDVIALADVRLASGACNSGVKHPCTEEEFRCHSGACVVASLTCDGFAHCVDSSDEWGDQCGPMVNATCDFDSPYKCGYQNRSTVDSLDWVQTLAFNFSEVLADENVTTYYYNRYDTSPYSGECTFPYEQNGKQLNYCSQTDVDDFAYCGDDNICLAARGLRFTEEGYRCVFPFIYQGVRYNQCLPTRESSVTWCALTDNFDRDRRHGNCTAACGGVYSSSYGMLFSPNHPGPYPNYMDCSYLIRTPVNATIILTFDHFAFEYSFDFITVFDGDDVKSPLLAHHLWGYELPRPIISSGGALLLHMHTDRSITKTGFLASYRLIQLQPENMVMALQPVEQHTSISKATSYLRSPKVTLEFVHCLSFKFFTKIGLSVSTLLETAWFMLLETKENHGKAWHVAHLNVPGGEHYIYWTTPHGELYESHWAGSLFKLFLAAIDEVVLSPGNCSGIVDDMYPVIGDSLVCSFEALFQCGYHDASPGFNKWLRMKRNGRFFLNAVKLSNSVSFLGSLAFSTLNHIPDTDTTILDSAMLTIHNATCVSVSIMSLTNYRLDVYAGPTFLQTLYRHFVMPVAQSWALMLPHGEYQLHFVLQHGHVMLDSIALVEDDLFVCAWLLPQPFDADDYLEEYDPIRTSFPQPKEEKESTSTSKNAAFEQAGPSMPTEYIIDNSTMYTNTPMDEVATINESASTNLSFINSDQTINETSSPLNHIPDAEVSTQEPTDITFGDLHSQSSTRGTDTSEWTSTAAGLFGFSVDTGILGPDPSPSTTMSTIESTSLRSDTRDLSPEVTSAALPASSETTPGSSGGGEDVSGAGLSGSEPLVLVARLNTWQLAANEAQQVSDGTPAQDTSIPEFTTLPTENAFLSDRLYPPSHDTNNAYLTNPKVMNKLGNLTEFYKSAGHQKGDLVYRCFFEGRVCDEGFMVSTITDQGQCVSFNADPNNITNTRKTGSWFGLSLTLNVEQYEYIEGSNTDAGIKVYLHDQRELPMIRDLGLAIEPGVHGLVAAKYIQNVMLGPPHGTCGELALNLTTGLEYTYFRCRRECEALHINATCGCIDAYMPGAIKVCELSEYLDCVVQRQLRDGSEVSSCTCPEACNVTTYSSDLSYATLSTLSVNSLLTSEISHLRHTYIRALEVRQRVEAQNLVSIITGLQNIAQEFQNYRRLVTHDAKIISGQVVQALQTLLLLTVEDTVGNVRSMLDAAWVEFEKKYSQTRRQMSGLKDELETQTEFMSWVNTVADEPGENTKDEFDDFLYLMKRTRRNLQWAKFDTSKEPASLLLGSSFNQFKIKRIWKTKAKEISCLKAMDDFTSTLETGINNFESYRPNSSAFLGVFQPSFATVLDKVHDISSKWEDCMIEFPETISSAQHTVSNMILEVKYTSSVIEDGLFSFESAFSKELVRIETYIAFFQQLREQYSNNSITMMSLVDQFNSEVQSRVITTMATLRSKMVQGIISPLQDVILDIDTRMYRWHKQLLDIYINVEGFFADDVIDGEAHAMEILRNPIVDLGTATVLVFSLEKSEVTQKGFWPAGMSMGDFRGTKYPVAMPIILETYLRPLQETLAQIEEDLLLAQDQVVKSINQLGTQLEDFKIKAQIDPNFVLENFLRLDIYYAALRYEALTQMPAYRLENYLSEIGGYMGLLIGASVLTLCEMLDLFLYNLVIKCMEQRSRLTKVGINWASGKLEKYKETTVPYVDT